MAVCYPLQGYLSMLGIQTEIVEADFGRVNHVWLQLPSGEIIDPTADQFSGEGCRFPEVYIGKVPEIFDVWIARAHEKRTHPHPRQSQENSGSKLE
jgi:hypothetical protein